MGFFHKKESDQKLQIIREKLVQDREIQKNMERISNRLVIFSGKGGVGKSTVTVNLAVGLAGRQFAVGLLDADVTGPNIPKMMGLFEAPQGENGKIIPLNKYGVKVISIGFLIEENTPVVWRGPLRSNLILQFLSDVKWGGLDFLLADLPPGTGDEVLTLAEKMRPTLAIVVTTPQEVAVEDARRAIMMARSLKIPKIAVIENMSGFLCPESGRVYNIFGSGGGEELAQSMKVDFLGRLPIDLSIREKCDAGEPAVLSSKQSNQSFVKIIDHLLEVKNK